MRRSAELNWKRWWMRMGTRSALRSPPSGGGGGGSTVSPLLATDHPSPSTAARSMGSPATRPSTVMREWQAARIQSGGPAIAAGGRMVSSAAAAAAVLVVVGVSPEEEEEEEAAAKGTTPRSTRSSEVSVPVLSKQQAVT